MKVDTISITNGEPEVKRVVAVGTVQDGQTVLYIVCAWCQKPLGSKDGQGVSGISHSICGNCLQAMTPRTEKCYWCGKVFAPDSFNRAHVGGQGEVYGCDTCLNLDRTPLVKIDLADALTQASAPDHIAEYRQMRETETPEQRRARWSRNRGEA